MTAGFLGFNEFLEVQKIEEYKKQTLESTW